MGVAAVALSHGGVAAELHLAVSTPRVSNLSEETVCPTAVESDA